MAAWPELDELKQLLDVTSDDWDGDDDYAEPTRLSRVLEAAIEKVKSDVGNWDEDVDVPDARLAQAALRMAELLAQRPGATANETASDPTYRKLMAGHRRRFAVS